MPLEDLPGSFELKTTLHLGDEDWFVVDASPRMRHEYSKSGALTLRLRRVVAVDPTDILFSLPSICDRIPAIGDAALTGDECVLHEDDWRQLELVSHSLAAECDAEIEHIYRIHENEREQSGWRKIHVRLRPDPPIPTALTLNDVDRAFDRELTFHGAAYVGAPKKIEAAYSFVTSDGLQCYGLAENGLISVFGVMRNFTACSSGRSVDAIRELAREFDLDLIDWCRCARASWDSPAFSELLGSDGS